MKTKLKKGLKIFLIVLVAVIVFCIAYMIWEDNQHYIYRKVKMVDCIETEVVSIIVVYDTKENVDSFLNRLNEEMGVDDNSIAKLRNELENRNFRYVFAVESRIENGKICIDHFGDVPGEFVFDGEETPGKLYIYTTNAYTINRCG